MDDVKTLQQAIAWLESQRKDSAHPEHIDAALAAMREKLVAHRQYVTTKGDDMPEVKNWKWSSQVHQEKKRDLEQE